MEIFNMRTYQILFKGGLKRNVEADGFERRKAEFVFFVTGNPVFRLDANMVVTVEEFHETQATSEHRLDTNWESLFCPHGDPFDVHAHH